MKRKLKGMYTEMLLDAVINGNWSVNHRKEYGIFTDWEECYFHSNKIKAGSYFYKLQFDTSPILSKTVHVHVYQNESSFSPVNADKLTYTIFSPMYWRLRQMKRDHINSQEIAETNRYIDVYKEFKKTAVERDIAKVEKSLANLSRAEAEQRKLLEQLKEKENGQRKTEIE